MSNNILLGSPEITEEDKQKLSKSISAIDTKINLVTLSPSTATKQDIEDINLCYNDINTLYHNMEVELSTFPESVKNKYNLSYYKSKILKIKKQIEEIKYLTKGFIEGDSEDEAKERLIDTNNNIDEGTRKMQESIKLMKNVNETDKNTMSSLKNQTSTMYNAKDILDQANTYIKRTSKVLNTMITKAFANKLILIIIIILLGLIDMFILYLKKFK